MSEGQRQRTSALPCAVLTTCVHCQHRQTTISHARHSPKCRRCKRPMTVHRTWVSEWARYTAAAHPQVTAPVPNRREG
jgi:hypothetical protein